MVVRTRHSGDDHHDRDLLRMRASRHFLQHDLPRHKRESEVEHHDVYMGSVEGAQRFESIPGFENLIPLEHERRAEHPPKLEIIFNQKDGLHLRRRVVLHGMAWL